MGFDIRAMRSDDGVRSEASIPKASPQVTPRLKRKFQSGRGGINCIFRTAA